MLPTPPATDVGQQSRAAAAVLSPVDLDGSNTRQAFTFVAPHAGDIHTLGFLLGTVTSAQDVTVSLQDIDLTTGAPDGVQDQTATLASGSQSSDTWVEVTLGTDRTVDEGDHVAMVLEWAGTQGDIEIDRCTCESRGGSVASSWNQAYAGSWGAKDTDNPPILYVEYSDASSYWIPGTEPLTTHLGEAINTGTTPDQIALKFKFPVSVRVAGMFSPMDFAANATVGMILYDSDGTSVLGSRTGYDEDETAQSSGGPWAAFFTQGPQTLTADTFYYAAVKPEAAISVTLFVTTVDAAKILDSWSGGQNFHYASKTDAGAWSATTTKRPCIYLIVDGIESGGAADSRLVGGGLVG
jgi:hypothetical protein